jgi:hypothetical protein
LAQHSCDAALERSHHRRWRVGRPDTRERVHVIGHHFLGHDLPVVLIGDLLQQIAHPTGTARPKILRRYSGTTTCRPSDDTPPGVQRNRRCDIPRTLRNDTDNHRIRHCLPGRIPPTAKAASPLRAQ